MGAGLATHSNDSTAPAQAWFQQLGELAVHVEVRAWSDVATTPLALTGSARHALSGAMLVFFRVAGRPRGQ